VIDMWYELGRVVERGGEESFKVTNLQTFLHVFWCFHLFRFL
jgi:hypothetical protein